MRPLFVLSILLLPLLAGCGQSSFVGRQVNDFTAYYNKFYNAQNVFEEEMRKLEDRSIAVDRTRYLPIFPVPEQSGNRQLEATITKSADVLRKHPNSRWVDDALLLIGKSYFFQQNYAAAEQKFREVIDLGTGLEDEARFWLARSLTANDAYVEAIEHIEASLLNQEEVDERWAARLHLIRGELAVQQARWEEAADEIERGLEGTNDNDLAARAQFALGQVYETLERYGDAAEAYRRVNAYRPVFELSYAALLSLVRVEGLYGDAGEALTLLRRMERDDKYYEDRAELAYLRGRIYQRQGRIDDAFIAFDELLYVSDANISGVRGRTHYALGELLRDDYYDYIRAAAHFDTAATALRTQQQEDVLYAPAAITDSREVAEMFESFASVMGRIEEADSLLRLGSMDAEAFDAFVLDLRRARAKELEEQRAKQERERSQRRFSDPNSASQRTLQNRTGGDAVGAGAAAETASSESGFLYHRSAQRVREAQRGFVERWGRRPHVPNWRRIQAVSAITADDEQVENPLDVLDEVEEGLPEIDVSAVPRDSVSFREVRGQRAMTRYELANVLFIQMNRPDSAAAWYRRVVEEDADQPVASRALYALAEVHRALGDTAAARRLQREVVAKYPESELATRLSEQLDEAPDVAVAPDTAALAEEAYAGAYAQWQDEDYDAALEHMVEVAVRFPGTDVAPRALLAAGSIALERVRRDSLDVLAPLDLALPDSVLVELGIIARAEVAAVDTSASDSLAQATSFIGADSLAASDSLVVGADSLAAADSTAPPADSVRTQPELAEPVEEVAPERPAPARFFAALTERYPDAPQAERAERILNALREREEAVRAVADSIAAMQQAAADSIAAAEQATREAALPADSLTESVVDSLVQASDSTTAPAVPEDSTAVQDSETTATPQLVPEERAVEPDSAASRRADSLREAKKRTGPLPDLNERMEEELVQPSDSVESELRRRPSERPVREGPPPEGTSPPDSTQVRPRIEP